MIKKINKLLKNMNQPKGRFMKFNRLMNLEVFTIYNSEIDMTTEVTKEVKKLRNLVWENKMLPFEIEISTYTKDNIHIVIKYHDENRTIKHIRGLSKNLNNIYDKKTKTKENSTFTLDFMGTEPLDSMVSRTEIFKDKEIKESDKK